MQALMCRWGVLSRLLLAGVYLCLIGSRMPAARGQQQQAGAPPQGAVHLHQTTVWQLLQVGLEPDRIAASQLAVSGIGAVAAELAASPSDVNGIVDANTALQSARASLTSALDACRRGGVTPELMAHRLALVQQIAALKMARNTHTTRLRQACVAALANAVGVENSALAARMIANSDRHVAEPFRALELAGC